MLQFRGRTARIFKAAILLAAGFATAVFLSYHGFLYLGTQTRLQDYSWNIAGEQRVIVWLTAGYYLIVIVCNMVAIWRARFRFDAIAKIILGFSLGLAAYAVVAAIATLFVMV